MDILWILLGAAALVALLLTLGRQVRLDGYGSTPPPASHAAAEALSATRGTPYF